MNKARFGLILLAGATSLYFLLANNKFNNQYKFAPTTLVLRDKPTLHCEGGIEKSSKEIICIKSKEKTAVPVEEIILIYQDSRKN